MSSGTSVETKVPLHMLIKVLMDFSLLLLYGARTKHEKDGQVKMLKNKNITMM